MWRATFHSILMSVLMCYGLNAYAKSIQANAFVTIKQPFVVSKLESEGVGKVSRRSRRDGIGSFLLSGEPNAIVGISLQNGTSSRRRVITDELAYVHDAGSSPQFNSDGILAFNVKRSLDQARDEKTKSNQIGYLMTLDFQ